MLFQEHLEIIDKCMRLRSECNCPDSTYVAFLKTDVACLIMVLATRCKTSRPASFSIQAQAYHKGSLIRGNASKTVMKTIGTNICKWLT